MLIFIVGGVVMAARSMVRSGGRASAIDTAWERLAERIGVDYIPRFDRNPPRVDGAWEGFDVLVSLEYGKPYKGWNTRVQAKFSSPLRFEFKVSETVPDFLDLISPLGSVETGDAAFDRAFRARSNDTEATLRLLDADTRQAILAFATTLNASPLNIETRDDLRSGESFDGPSSRPGGSYHIDHEGCDLTIRGAVNDGEFILQILQAQRDLLGVLERRQATLRFEPDGQV